MTFEARLLALLEAIACDKRACRLCGQLIYFVKLNSGWTAPYGSDGINHFENCPEYRKRRSSPAQQPLLGPTQPSGFDPQR